MWELDYKKKAERQRIDAFELWCWRRLLRVPRTAWRSNQSILKEISPEYSLEGLMLKLKLQYFGHLMWRTDSLEKTLILGKIEGRRRRGWQRMIGWHHQINGDEFEKTLEVGDGQRGLACCSPWVCKESDTTEWLNWTEVLLDSLWPNGCQASLSFTISQSLLKLLSIESVMSSNHLILCCHLFLLPQIFPEQLR